MAAVLASCVGQYPARDQTRVTKRWRECFRLTGNNRLPQRTPAEPVAHRKLGHLALTTKRQRLLGEAHRTPWCLDGAGCCGEVC